MINLEMGDLDILREKFSPLIVSKAVNSAISKTAKKARTLVSKKIRQKYNVKANKINAALKVLKTPPYRDLISERVLSYTGKRISLINFGAKRVRVKGTKRKGVSVLVKKGGGRKIIKGKNKYGAFIAEGKNNNVHVFMRESSLRFPVEKRDGPSIPGMISATETKNEIDEFVGVEMQKQFDHELRYFLTKAGAI